MALTPDPFRNPTALITRVVHAVVAGGAAGNITLTGVDGTDDRLISVIHLPEAQGMASGARIVSTAEGTAGTLDISTSLATVVSYQLMVLTAAGVFQPLVDAAISESGGTITVADGAATFALTATDIIHWIALASSLTQGAPDDLTSEFSITADDTINNTAGTVTTGGLLLVEYYDHDLGELSEASWQE